MFMGVLFELILKISRLIFLTFPVLALVEKIIYNIVTLNGRAYQIKSYILVTLGDKLYEYKGLLQRIFIHI